jgi:hypothetical protein
MSQDQVLFDESAVGSLFVDPGKLSWQASDAPGFDTIKLFENRLTGESTVLMKVAPGAFADVHSHELLEEIYVLEGEFADQTQCYAKGQYCASERPALRIPRRRSQGAWSFWSIGCQRISSRVGPRPCAP